MLSDKINSIIKDTFGAFGIVLIVLAIFSVAPFLLIWAINTLAASGGSDFHIAHGLWNYFVAIVLLILVRGGS